MVDLSAAQRALEKRDDHPGVVLTNGDDMRVVVNRLTLEFVVQQRERRDHRRTAWFSKHRFKCRQGLHDHFQKRGQCNPTIIKKLGRLPIVVGARRP